MSELPTWRTLMKDRRQSWSAPWWSLWKTSGCSSSRMASTLLKKVMWFCCRNSCMFKWMRPCRSPAIMGRCLGRKNSQRLESTIRGLTDKNTVPILNFFFLPEQKYRMRHSQLPARKVGIRYTTLSRLGVSYISKQRDQAMHQDIKLRKININTGLCRIVDFMSGHKWNIKPCLLIGLNYAVIIKLTKSNKTFCSMCRKPPSANWQTLRQQDIWCHKICSMSRL